MHHDRDRGAHVLRRAQGFGRASRVAQTSGGIVNWTTLHAHGLWISLASWTKTILVTPDGSAIPLLLNGDIPYMAVGARQTSGPTGRQMTQAVGVPAVEHVLAPPPMVPPPEEEDQGEPGFRETSG